MFEDTFTRIESLASHLKEYIDAKIALAKLNLAEKSSKILSNVIATMIVGIIFLFFIFFSSFALGYFLGQKLNNIYFGFLIVAGIYLLLGLIIWFGRERILRVPIMQSIIRQLFKSDEASEED